MQKRRETVDKYWWYLLIYQQESQRVMDQWVKELRTTSGSPIAPSYVFIVFSGTELKIFFVFPLENWLLLRKPKQRFYRASMFYKQNKKVFTSLEHRHLNCVSFPLQWRHRRRHNFLRFRFFRTGLWDVEANFGVAARQGLNKDFELCKIESVWFKK